MTWVWHPLRIKGWTLFPGGWFYELGDGRGLSVGEWESRCGPIFGRSILVVNPPQPRRYRLQFDWEPSYCEECGRDLYWPQTTYTYNNPHYYRCCFGCWNAIRHQLWHRLEDELSTAPANIVWYFLLEPAGR